MEKNDKQEEQEINANEAHASDENQVNVEEAHEEDLPEPATHKDDSPEGKIQEEVEELQQHIDELNDKYLRLYSEFENFRKRTARERLDLINTAGADVIKDVLPVLDDFDRAIQNNENSKDIEAIKEGVKLVHQKLKNSMTQKGVKEMEAMGTPFDPEIHEAVTKIPAPEKKLKGKVVDVIEKGYYLHDKVIRYAKVVVGE